MRLEHKRAVIVGAGQSPGQGIGIGRATALLFAREGARVLLVDRDGDAADETRAMIDGAGGDAAVHVADVSQEDDCRSMAAAAGRALGGVDVLFNGVGIHGPGTATELTEEIWDRVMHVNLKAMWLTAKHVLPMMIEQRSGSIVNVSSIGALNGGNAMVYGISKAGVNRLTLSLAATYARYDIRANAVMPGLIDTPMAIDQTPARQDLTRDQYVAQRDARVPMAYKGSAWDVAYAALFFASDDSRFVSGTLMPVDGAVITSRDDYLAALTYRLGQSV